MANLKETIADGLQVLRAATDPNDVVRKAEFDTAIALKADTTYVDDEITDQAHDPVTAPATNQTLTLAVDANQAVTGEVTLPSESELQAADTGLSENFTHPRIAGEMLQLAKTVVSSVVVTRENGGLIETGVLDTDYILDAALGGVTILTGSNLITETGQFVKVAYDCAQVLDGPGLEATASGLQAKLGTTHETVPRGDHIHTNDHRAATGGSTECVTIAVDERQRITGDVTLSADSGLEKAGDGLAVDWAEVAAEDHTHAAVDESNPGFMTSAMLADLTEAASATAITVADTDTVNLTKGVDGIISADVVEGAGLTSDENGLAVDMTAVAAIDHAHYVVGQILATEITSRGSGYTSAAVVVTDQHGWGSGAVIYANVVSGEVDSLDIINVGTGYQQPLLEITGDGSNATATATSHWLEGFANPTMVVKIENNQEFMDGVDDRLIIAEADIVTLLTDKADAADLTAAVDALNVSIAGKADTAHVHAIADVTNLQTQLDEKLNSDTFDDPEVTALHIHASATGAVGGFMSAEDKDKFDCLKKILNEREEALMILPSLRLESPDFDGPGDQNCPLTLFSDSVVVGGEVGTEYQVNVHVRGVTELKLHTGGTPVTGSGGLAVLGGTPGTNLYNAWKLIISDPSAEIYLNTTATDPGEIPEALDYNITITAAGGATVSLFMDSIDGQQYEHTVGTPEGIPPYGVGSPPYIFDGQFVQVDAESILNFCLFKSIFGEGVDDIPPTGGVIPRQDVGDPPSPPPGTTPLPGAPPGGPLQIVRDLRRFDLCPCGEADDDVNEILVDGEAIWIGGAFKRWGNVDCYGLAKLDLSARYDPMFLIGGGFSKPVKFIRKVTGGVLAAGEQDSLFQGSVSARPIWKVLDNGDNDDAFACPFVLNEVGGESYGDDKLVGLAVDYNEVAWAATPRVLSRIVSGAVTDQWTGSEQFNSVVGLDLEDHEILLSSRAYSADGIEQYYNGTVNPKGLKWISDGSISANWRLPSAAGTGASASCGVTVLGPMNEAGTAYDFFITGNARANYFSPDTSWNADMIGNLILRSEQFDNASWTKVGASPVVVANDANDPTGTLTAEKIQDTDGATLAYVYQDVALEEDVSYWYCVNIKKDTDETRFPVIQLQSTGGTPESAPRLYINTKTGDFLLGGVVPAGVGTPEVTAVGTAPDEYWLVKVPILNSDHTSCRFSIYPAYTATWGGTAESVTGFTHAWGAHVRRDAWEDEYIVTTDTAIIPDASDANADRFRGLYKIMGDGTAAPAETDEPNTGWFAINIVLSEVGHVIPFFVDPEERIYFGGPVNSINGVAVKPWRLYRVDTHGRFEAINGGAEFRYFDGKVLVARLLPNGNIAVGGEFTGYGSYKVGRFIIIRPDGSVVYPSGGECNVIVSDTEPDVAVDPSAMDKIWLKPTTTVPEQYKYNRDTAAWVLDTVSTGRTPNVHYHSTDSENIGTGDKVFTVTETDIDISVGTRMRASQTSAPANYVEGLVTDITGSNITINSDTTGGSGTGLTPWTINLAGDPGSGATGGSVWLNGSGAPGAIGSDGDYYLRTSNGDVYNKVSGSWGSPICNIFGAAGSNGALWFTDTGVPGVGVGNNGDFYLDDATGDVYYKSGGAWALVMNIQGDDGAAGNDGADGRAPHVSYTSSSSVAIGTGSKQWTVVEDAIDLGIGARVRATSGANYMDGIITGITGQLMTVNVTVTSGTGTLSTWVINPSGDPGATGAPGRSGLDAICAKVVRTGDYNLSNTSTYYPLQFTSVEYDTDGIFSLSTLPTRLTCQTSGKYHIVGLANLSAGTMGGIGIRKNGSVWIAYSTAGPSYRTVSADANLAAGDYIEMIVVTNTVPCKVDGASFPPVTFSMTRMADTGARWLQKSVAIATPSTPANALLIYTPTRIRAENVFSVIRGSSNPSVYWIMLAGPNRDGSGSAVVVASGLTASTTTAEAATLNPRGTGGADTGVVEANQFVWITTGNGSPPYTGTVTELFITADFVEA